MFDRALYKSPGKTIDQLAWIAMQRDACASTLLTQGRLVEWSEAPGYFETLVRGDLELACANDATALLACRPSLVDKGVWSGN